jgi:protein gp37
MSYRTSIEWTDSTWNPIIGCSKVSAGCKYCYAEAITRRFEGVKGHPFELGFKIRLRPDKLDEPAHWKSPRKIFACSMSDLFHEEVPFEFIQQVFQVMATEKRHTFQLLTKRAERLVELSPTLLWISNIWMGVSVENDTFIDRIQSLKSVPAAVRFISFEPLLGPLPKLNLNGIDWVIVGGESGTQARKMEIEWARGIRDQCVDNHIPFFFKQFGGKRGKKGGETAILDGAFWHQFPTPKMDRLNPLSNQ